MNETTKIPTLKNMKAFREGHAIPQKAGFCLFAQHVSSIQVATPDGYYAEAANPGIRGGRSSRDVVPGHFDVAVAPGSMEVDSLKTGFMSILREKAINDIVAYEELLKAMVVDGKITEKDAEAAKVTPKDVGAEFLVPRMSFSNSSEKDIPFSELFERRKESASKIKSFAASLTI